MRIVRRAGAAFSAALAALVILHPFTAAGAVQCGEASWYNAHKRDMTYAYPAAAHVALPIGSRALVENLENGRSVVVRISDRGPFVRGRIIDVSRPAAKALGFEQDGVAPVRVVPLDTRGLSVDPVVVACQ
jgi:rare lipoprotein A